MACFEACELLGLFLEPPTPPDTSGIIQAMLPGELRNTVAEAGGLIGKQPIEFLELVVLRRRHFAETLQSGGPLRHIARAKDKLLCREQYLAAAEAYIRGIERRVAAGLDPRIASVASLFVSRWDSGVKDKVPAPLRNRLGIAVAMQSYKAYRDLLASPRWQSLARIGAHPQRLLWASTGTKDPAASESLYVEALAAPDTINTIPEKTLLAFAGHGASLRALPVDGGDAERVLAEFANAGIDTTALAAELQRDGAAAFTKSWSELMIRIAQKSEALAEAGG